MVFRAPQERCADAGRGVGKQAEGRKTSGAPENWHCTRILPHAGMTATGKV